MDIPWKSLAPIEPGREYIALLSYLPLTRYSKMPLFFRYSGQINAQLRADSGRNRLLDAREAFHAPILDAFGVGQRQGADGICREGSARRSDEKIAPYMDKTNFWRWKLPSAEIPPRWDDAMRRASASG